jgi:hypothetical protein
MKVKRPKLLTNADATPAKLPRGVRVVEARTDGAYVVEVEAPKSSNPLVRAFRALTEIGVRLVHTEVRVATDSVVQRFHLLEPDESPLSPPRLMLALTALATACHVVAVPLVFA